MGSTPFGVHSSTTTFEARGPASLTRHAPESKAAQTSPGEGIGVLIREKGLAERQDVLPAVAQRRQLDREHMQSRRLAVHGEPRLYPGRAHRRHNPVATWQGHISHSLPRRSWIAFDAGCYFS